MNLGQNVDPGRLALESMNLGHNADHESLMADRNQVLLRELEQTSTSSPTSAPIENDWGKPELLHNFLHQVRPLTLVIVCRRLAQPLSMIRGQVPMLARIGTPIAGATLGGVLVVRQASTPVYAMEPTMVWPACLLRPIGAVYLYCTQPPVPSGTVKIFIISFHPPHGHVHIHHRTQRCHRCRQYATTTHTHTHTRTTAFANS